MKKLILFAVIVIAAMGADAQDAKKGCDPKACKPGNTKVEEAEVISNLRSKVVKLSGQVKLQAVKEEDLIGKSEEESLELISSEISGLSSLLNLNDFQATGTGANLVGQLTSYVDKLVAEMNKSNN